MIVSLNLLRKFLDFDADENQLGEILTMLGQEVEQVIVPGEDLDKVFIGHIKKMYQHPNAERLQVCNVDVGDQELQIVCGGTNQKEGDKVPVAFVGTKLPCGLEMKAVDLRGVESLGMLCSQKELGVSEEDSGIWILPEDTKVGISLKQLLQNRTALDLEITPNRPDCLSHLGIARELAAYYNKEVSLPEVVNVNRGSERSFNRVEGCNSYKGVIVRNVKVADSPSWLKDYLADFNIKSINNLVDISNYVMMELGRPSHVFDLDKLTGDLEVRNAKQGEKFIGLDDETYELDGKDLVVADHEKLVAIAGILGSSNSGVSANTQNILIEVAHFDEKRVRRSSKALHLSSESSYRFERGIDFNSSDLVMGRILKLINELSGGIVEGEIISYSNNPYSPVTIEMSVGEMNKYLGTDIATERVVGILQSLNIDCSVDGDTVQGIPPSYRQDLKREVDFYEEVARVYGYDKIEPQMPAVLMRGVEIDETLVLQDKVKSFCIALGLNEVVNYSFVASGSGLKISNPINEEFAVMREDIYSSLLANIKLNLNNGSKAVSIFEVANTYSQDKEETLKLSIALSGVEDKSLWDDKLQYDFYHIKGVVESLNNSFNLECIFKPSDNENLHPYRSSDIFVGGNKVGFFGELHPLTLKKYGLKKRAFVCEMLLDTFSKEQSHELKEISKYPAVERDIAIVVDNNISGDDLVKTIKQDSLVRDAEIFDIYSGDQLAKGKKSVAVRFILQSYDKTLTDQDIYESVKGIIESLEQNHGGKLRE